MKLLLAILLAVAVLPAQAQTVNICDRTAQVRDAILRALEADDCAAVGSTGMAAITEISIAAGGVTALQARDFDGLYGLLTLNLNENQLTTLPAGVFGDLHALYALNLRGNQLTILPAGVFDGPDGLFDLNLRGNQLTTLPAGVFDGLDGLYFLNLRGNQLTTLPAGVFDGLTTMATGTLNLRANRLTTLPASVFDGLTIGHLLLNDNQLTTLPAGVFDSVTILYTLDLRNNHLVGLTRDDPLFAMLSSLLDILLAGQTEPGDTRPPPPVRIAAAVPLMLSTFDSTRQGFVRIVNESDDSGSVRVFAFDDGGHAPDPIEIPLGAGQVVHFNSNDLENGNARKGIEGGVGGPVQGDWRLDVESALPLRVLAFVRPTDGFLTAMHDVLPRNDEGRLVAQIFNPGSNMNQESRLRLVNTGAEAAGVSIEGVDDQGNDAGPVTLTLSAGESRTLTAFDLENGAQGLAGTLGDGAGKWRLFIGAGGSVVGMGLLASVSGHLTNISTAGVADE